MFGLLRNLGIMKKIYLLIVSIVLLSCSDESENPESDPTTPQVNLAAIEGRYTGSWNWEFGTGFISMIISPLAESNRFSVEFFETIDFRPMFNSDGVTPEARGILTVDGTSAEIQLNLNTDNPLCQGDYNGSGIRSSNGQLELTMDIVHDCAEDAPATWSLLKIAD